MKQEHDLLSAFTADLHIRGRKPDTIAEYRTAVTGFIEYLDTHTLSLFAAKEENAFGWRELLESSGCCRRTALKKLHCVHAFYAWLQDSGYLLVNQFPCPSWRGLQRLPRRIPSAETLTKAFRSLGRSPLLPDQRDYITLDLGYSCGLRRCELQRLDLDDIDAANGLIRVRGKGDRERLVPVGKRTLRELMRYIYHVRPKFIKGSETKALLVCWQKGGARLNIRSINRAFTRIRGKYGLDKAFTPHGLRHAFATDLVKNGAPVQDVSEMLGHKKLETTQVYTRLTALDLRANHARYHPRG